MRPARSARVQRRLRPDRLVAPERDPVTGRLGSGVRGRKRHGDHRRSRRLRGKTLGLAAGGAVAVVATVVVVAALAGGGGDESPAAPALPGSLRYVDRAVHRSSAPFTVSDIVAVAPDGTQTPVTDALDDPGASSFGVYGYSEPALSPDGSQLIATYTQGSSGSAVLMSLTGEVTRRVSDVCDESHAAAPAWVSTTVVTFSGHDHAPSYTVDLPSGTCTPNGGGGPPGPSVAPGGA